MPRYYREKNSLILGSGNTTLSQPGRLSGGVKPLERQIPVNDFYRAGKKAFSSSPA
jgi:hypothetical protein